MKIQKQSPKLAGWVDESGKFVPGKMLKKYEKVNEMVTYEIADRAIKASQFLQRFKTSMEALLKKAIDAFHAEYKGKRTEFKGNYTMFNFNHTIKIEISVSTPVKFDDLLINKAKEILNRFLDEGVNAKNKAIKQMVMEAFETTRGKMDVKKIMGLKRYADRIKDARYTEAMSLIDQAQRRPDSATYHRIWIKDETGKWHLIPLALKDLK